MDLTGLDLEGKHQQKSVFEGFADYVQRSRFIFVNKSPKGEGIQLSSTLGMISYKRYDEIGDTVGKSALNEGQAKTMMDYCYKKKKSLQDFLVNTVGFKAPAISANKEAIFTWSINKDTVNLEAGSLNHFGADFKAVNLKTIYYEWFIYFGYKTAGQDCAVFYLQKP